MNGIKISWFGKWEKLSIVYRFIFITILILLSTSSVNSELNPGVLNSHEPNEKIAYHWYSYIPEGLDKKKPCFILISGQHGNTPNENYMYDDLIAETYKLAESRTYWAEVYKYVILTPVIPRNRVPHIYSVAFDKNCFLEDHIVTNQAIDSFYKRPDLKVNLMIDELKRLVELEGYTVANKVFVEGFSAGGMFTQRYCLLHPDRVQAATAGHNGGSLTLPGADYSGSDMNWPVGINDFYSLTGVEFNLEEYKKVPQFIYIGDRDNDASTVYWTHEHGGLFSQTQIDFLIQKFGDTDPLRLKNQSDFLADMGCNVQFKSYEGFSHADFIPESITDTFEFFAKHKEKIRDTLFFDSDGDGFGDLTQSVESDSKPNGYVDNYSDCNDNDSSVHPDAVDICGDGIDQDCNDIDGPIKIDGKRMDWNNFEPVLTDPKGDTNNGSQMDLKQAFLEIEGQSAIFMIETFKTPIMGNNSSIQVDFEILESDGNLIHTGMSIKSDGSIWPFIENPNLSGNIEKFPLTGFKFTSKDVLEAVLPLNNFNNPEKMRLTNVTLFYDYLNSSTYDDEIHNHTEIWKRSGFFCDFKNMWYSDLDNDGFGDPNDSKESNSQPTRYVTDNTDCNDNDSSIHPAASEIRGDGIDQDCNGSDLPPLNTYYQDNDNDGYGNPNESIESESQPIGYVTDNTDCNDSNSEIHPGSTEIQNSEDDNCDGLVEGMTPGKVALSVPNNTTDNKTPKFKWQEDSYATWYQVYLQDGSEKKVYANWYSSTSICSLSICEVTPETVLKNDNYQWWTKSWNEYGNTWSDGLTFVVQGENSLPAKVTLLSPSGQAQGDITFTWAADPAATWYKLWIGFSSGEKVYAIWFDASQICSENDCTVAIEDHLSNGSYEWYVKSWNEYGKVWSDGMGFNVMK